MIPSEYAKKCYFRELRKCRYYGGEMVAKKDLDKCIPVFTEEMMEDGLGGIENRVQYNQ